MKLNDWVLGLICLRTVTPLHLYSHVFLAKRCTYYESIFVHYAKHLNVELLT